MVGRHELFYGVERLAAERQRSTKGFARFDGLPVDNWFGE